MEKENNVKDRGERLVFFLCYWLLIISVLPIWTENMGNMLGGMMFMLDFAMGIIATANILFFYIIQNNILEYDYEKYRSFINKKNAWENILKEIKSIAKEILKFIPIFIIGFIVYHVIIPGDSVNETKIDAALLQNPIESIWTIVITPFYEEMFFRYFPRKFIKNDVIYIIISSVIFAGLHVIHDPRWYIFIWAYMINSVYFGYKYLKTNDILVTMSLHSFNNFLSVLLLFLLNN